MNTTTIKMRLQSLYGKCLMLFFGMVYATSPIYGQDNQADNHKIKIGIPSVALMDLEYESGADIFLQVNAPSEAGEKANTGGNVSTVWLNYTSIINSTRAQIINSSSPLRNISTRISSGTLPGALQLKVTATADAGFGKGTKGQPAGGGIILNDNSQILIDQIGSCYTGNGTGKGHLLTYALLINDDETALLDAGLNNTEIAVTYTISDN